MSKDLANRLRKTRIGECKQLIHRKLAKGTPENCRIQPFWSYDAVSGRLENLQTGRILDVRYSVTALLGIPFHKKPKEKLKGKAKPRLRLFSNTKYGRYLVSPEWRERRAAAIAAQGFKCQRCGRRRDLQVHHKTYKNLGKERDEDLEVLCRDCHEIHHGIQ